MNAIPEEMNEHKDYETLLAEHAIWCESVAESAVFAKNESDNANDVERARLNDALQDQFTRAQQKAGPDEPGDDDIIRGLADTNGYVDCRYLTELQAEIVIRNTDEWELIPVKISFKDYLAATVLQEPVPVFDNDTVNQKHTDYRQLRDLHKRHGC